MTHTLTPVQISVAHRALQDLETVIGNWRKSELITHITFYYNGHPSSDNKDPALAATLKNSVVNFYREQVFAKLKHLEQLGVNTSTLFPEDLK